MKAVMISIQPKWLEKILNGEKTIEVRKIAPKIEIPFKAYIYCTKPKSRFRCGAMCFYDDELYRDIKGNIKYGSSIELMACPPESYSKDNFLNGTVVGEFVCDKISTYSPYKLITKFNPCVHSNEYLIFGDDLKATCLTYEEIKAYGDAENKPFAKIKPLYGLHISDLKIYDKPKEIEKFFVKGACRAEICYKCPHYRLAPAWYAESGCKDYSLKPLTRPFQSWGYVEEA